MMTALQADALLRMAHALNAAIHRCRCKGDAQRCRTCVEDLRTLQGGLDVLERVAVGPILERPAARTKATRH